MMIRCLALSLLLAIARLTEAQGTCFSGPIRAGCSGFVLFEGNAVLSSGGPERHSFPIQGTFRDLPDYLTFAAGYLRVVDPRTAIGAVAEVGAGQTSDEGTRWRLAAVGRWRRQLDNRWAVDAGAGPLAVQVNTIPGGLNGPQRVFGYGGTTEATLN
jgi:hypothetical protein